MNPAISKLRVAICAIALLNLAACTDADTGPQSGGVDRSAATSASILLTANERLLAVSPDDNRVVEFDPVSLSELQHWDLGWSPSELLETSSGVLITSEYSSKVGLLDGKDLSEVATTCSGVASASALTLQARELVALSCPAQSAIELWSRDYTKALEQATRVTLATSNQPARVVLEKQRLTSITQNGVVSTWQLRTDGSTAGASSEPKAASSSLAVGDPMPTGSKPSKVRRPRGREVSLLRSAVLSPVGPLAGYQSTDNETALAATDPASTGSYGTLIEGMARIEPTLSTWCPARISDFAHPETSISGISALAVDAVSDRLWVVGQFSGTVLVLDCASPADNDRARLVAGFSVGVGARGIALAPDGRTAYVDLALDHAVAKLVVSDSGQVVVGQEPVLTRAWEPGPMTMSEQAQVGRRQFMDATNTQLTPSGIATCASCHPAAGEDGLAWRISTRKIATKYRRTPPLWGLVTGQKPLHWDGEFDTVETLSATTTRELLAGSGLLVGSASMARYLTEVRVPFADFAGLGNPSEEELQGHTLFNSAETGCSSCHTGAFGTDGLAHEILDGSPEPNGALSPSMTPRLLGLGARSEFFHDGSADTLSAVLEAAALDTDQRHGTIKNLNKEQRDALLRYLTTR